MKQENDAEKLSRLAKNVDPAFQKYWQLLHEKGSACIETLLAKSEYDKNFASWEKQRDKMVADYDRKYPSSSK